MGGRAPVKMQSGITLTEVVVGLALLGTLLTIMLVGAGRLERQRSAAESKLAAVAALDRLISRFFSNGFPALPSSGPMGENEYWVWKMSRVNTAAPQGCLVARISIVDLRRKVESSGANSNDELSRDREIATIDVLIADVAFGRNKFTSHQP